MEYYSENSYLVRQGSTIVAGQPSRLEKQAAGACLPFCAGGSRGVEGGFLAWRKTTGAGLLLCTYGPTMEGLMEAHGRTTARGC
jgi:hypothetical protein